MVKTACLHCCVCAAYTVAMGAAFSQAHRLLHNPDCVDLSTLMRTNVAGSILLGFAAVWATVESAIVLAALCYGVPALRQQGAGLTGYLWRLGHCLCIPRRKTADEEATAYREQYEAYVKAYAAYYGQPDVRTATQHPARPARSSDTISSRPPTPPPKGEDEAARLARRAERDAIRSARARRRAIKALERERERSKPRADPPSRSPTPPDDSFEELLDLYSSGVTDDSVAKPSRESIAAAQAARETRKGRSGRRR